jgi:galactose mutarotase-like enzyme
VTACFHSLFNLNPQIVPPQEWRPRKEELNSDSSDIVRFKVESSLKQKFTLIRKSGHADYYTVVNIPMLSPTVHEFAKDRLEM